MYLKLIINDFKNKLTMKRKFFIGSSIILGVLITWSFLACQKTSNSPSNNVTQSSPQTVSENAARNGDQSVYYSRDVDGTVYKMIIAGNPDQKLNIIRSVYNTNNPEDYNTTTLFDGDLVDATTNGSVVAVVPNGSRKYFYIPFNPNIEPTSVISGGNVTFYCQSGCIDGAKTCDAKFATNGPDFGGTCVGTCTICTAKSTCSSGGAGSAPVNMVVSSGFYVLSAAEIHVVNN